MSRLYDDVAKILNKPAEETPIVVDITNVASYWAMHERDTWDLTTDFPITTPPFKTAFFEWRVPGLIRINGEVHDQRAEAFHARCGCLVISNDAVKLTESAGSIIKLLTQVKQEELRGFMRDSLVLASKSKWLCEIYGFIQLGADIIESFRTQLGIDDVGKVVTLRPGITHSILFTGYQGNPQDFNPEGATKGVAGYLHPLLLATSFMHCKNVVRKENVPPPKVQARRAKDGKLPLTKYYTLEIEAMKRTLQSEGGISTNGLKKALHICRGHFATYTADKPLFGHYVGTVWKPQHVKGSKESGEIIKDYAVKGPKVTP